MTVLSTIVAGPYAATWSATAIGDVEDGFRLRFRQELQNVVADPWGDSVIDQVYRGGNFFLSFVCMEYSSAIAVMWPWATNGLMGQAGRLVDGSSIAAAAVLTAVTGTTASSAPATLTASKTAPSENSQPDIQFASRNRTVPIEWRLFPYDTGAGAIGWFTVT